MNTTKVVEQFRFSSGVRRIAISGRPIGLALKKGLVGAAMVVITATAIPTSYAQNNGDTLIWNGGTSQSDWGGNSLIWWDNGTAVKLSTGALRHNNYLFVFGGAAPNPIVPTTMSTNGNTFYSTSLTFENGFNSTNTTSLINGSPTNSSLVLGESGGQGSNAAAPWSITDNATSGVVTLGPTAGNGNNNLTFSLFSSGTISVAGGGNVTISLAVNDFSAAHTGGITKTGTGTLIFSGANTYSGGTTVNAGTVLVNNTTGSGTGTGTVIVNNSGTLGGIGTISGAVSVTPGGTIDAGPPGTAGSSSAVGTLHTGALTLTSGSTFHADAFGTAANQWDQLIVNGAAILGGSTFKLNIASGLTFAAGTTYVLIDATTISGMFAGLTEGSTQTYDGYTFTVHYDTANGNFDLICAVPEPGTWLASALAVAGVAYSQRRRICGLISSLA